MIGYEEQPSRPEDLMADYRSTLDCLRECLGANAKHAAVLDTGERIYAAMLSPLTQYGALVGDEKLLLIVTEGSIYSDEDDEPIATEYGLYLYHLGRDETEVEGHEAAADVFCTGATLEEIGDYDEDKGERWRDILEAASLHDRFDYFEAWYRVEDEHDSDLVRWARMEEQGSEILMKRALKRWRAEQRRVQRAQQERED